MALLGRASCGVVEETVTKIMTCSCQHQYQDDRYGKGHRVHNQAKSKDPKFPVWRCTVCSSGK